MMELIILIIVGGLIGWAGGLLIGGTPGVLSVTLLLVLLVHGLVTGYSERSDLK